MRITNLPYTGIKANTYNMEVWRGTNVIINLPFEFEMEHIIGEDMAFDENFHEDDNPVTMHEPVPLIELYKTAIFTVYKKNFESNPLFVLETETSGALYKRDGSHKTLLEAATSGIGNNLQTQTAFIHLSRQMTTEFAFDYAEYKIEFIGDELDSKDNVIIDRVFQGKITVFGEAI